ncbi:MAG: L,D-transpeptidase, partial [Caulobacteraceae bacterium]
MKKFFLAVIIIVVCFSIVFADSTAGTTRIEINIPSLTLSLFKDGKPVKAYPVCVGKQSTPTPQGNYNVIYKTINPYWINKGTVVSPGPQNPLGV